MDTTPLCINQCEIYSYFDVYSKNNDQQNYFYKGYIKYITDCL